MSDLPIYVSKSETYVAGSPWEVNLAFLPARGPNGGRVVIDHLLLVGTMSLTTDGATSIDTEDYHSFLKRFHLKDSVGNRYDDVSGFMMRQIMLTEYGAQAPADPAALAISTGPAARTIYWMIPMAQPRALRPVDFSLPVDELVSVKIEMAAVSDLVITGSGLTIGASSFQLFAFCREEQDLIHHSRAIWSVTPMTANTYQEVPLTGSRLRALYVTKAAVNGGSSLANLTDATWEPHGYVSVPRAIFELGYQRSAGYISTSVDPVARSLLTPIVFPRPNQKQTAMRLFTKNPPLKLNSSVTTPDLLICKVDPKSEVAMAAANVANGAHPGAPQRIKTAAKTQRDPAAFGDLAAFLPVKVRRK